MGLLQSCRGVILKKKIRICIAIVIVVPTITITYYAGAIIHGLIDDDATVWGNKYEMCIARVSAIYHINELPFVCEIYGTHPWLSVLEDCADDISKESQHDRVEFYAGIIMTRGDDLKDIYGETFIGLIWKTHDAIALRDRLKTVKKYSDDDKRYVNSRKWIDIIDRILLLDDPVGMSTL